MSTHVDDFCWEVLKQFYNEVIDPLHKIFEVGADNSCSFKCVGLKVLQNQARIEVDQKSYISSIEPIKIGKSNSQDNMILSAHKN